MFLIRLQLIAASSLYLAGKIKDDDTVKIRDVINVAYSTLNRGSAPLDLNDEYWAMRDAIVQAELLITRTLSFDLNIELAHKVSIEMSPHHNSCVDTFSFSWLICSTCCTT